MQEDKKQIIISQQTREKVESAKVYIERRYSRLIQQERDKKQNWELLYKKMQSLHFSEQEQEALKKNILHKEAEQLRAKRRKISIQDYQSIKIIGKGAFGQVRLCKNRIDSRPVAIKKMTKSQMVHKNKIFQAREEKDILANSENNQWIVELKCSFQDQKNLYLVMEYLSGGDLMNLLIKRDILTEDQTRFYIAEILLALDSVHKLHYIHRDLKPDNVLIDEKGHIKLSDFGLCKYTQLRPKKLNQVKKDDTNLIKKKIQFKEFSKQNYKKNRKLAYSAVGTPDYVAPEVQGKGGYTETVDWWSMGVIMYEMLVGYPPFVSQDPSITWHKIQNWKKYLVIPKQANLSYQAVDLIRRLMNDQKDRLGVNGVEEIKKHPFFTGVDWKKIREKPAPYIPEIKNPFDTQNFDHFEEGEEWIKQQSKRRKDVMFIGYTFKNNNNQKSELLKALLDLDNTKIINEEPHKNIVDSLQIDPQAKYFKKDKSFSKIQSLNSLNVTTQVYSVASTAATKNLKVIPETTKFQSPKPLVFKTTKQSPQHKQQPSQRTIFMPTNKPMVSIKSPGQLKVLSPTFKKK